MKRNILIIALCAIVAVGVTSCDKEKTKTELLTEKGWKLTKATSNPPYELAADVAITDLFDGFIYEWEKDDILRFKEDGGQYLDPGKNLEEGQTSGEKLLGKWGLNEAGTELTFYLPFYFDFAPDAKNNTVIGTITVLNETTLTMGVKISEDDEVTTTKTKRNYDFVLTYTKQ